MIFSAMSFSRLSILNLIMLIAFVAGVQIGWCGEIILHRGDKGAMTIGGGNPLSHFQEVFYIDEALLAKQPLIDLRAVDPPVSIPDAVASTARRLDLGRVVIMKAELINYQKGTAGNLSKGVFFYVLELFSPKGIEKFVVLMDGSLIKPRRERITGR